jgi:ATP-dependent RNA helicase DDX51/DBP6
MNIKNLFPVQEKVIPWILDNHKKPIPFRPRDVCVSAVTGSGKTLSYAVPIVQNIMENRMECKVRALVMLPVFELAKQVFSVFEKLCNNLKVRCVLLSKNRPLEVEQNLLLKPDGESKVDIIVTTGGRLVEHLFYTKNFSLKSLKFLVIDEADHAMAQVQNDWYYHYIQHIGVVNELQSNRLSYSDLLALTKDNGEFKIPQKLLLSATLSQDPEKINVFNLFQPKLFTTSDNKEDLMKYQARKLQEEQRGNFIGKYTTPAELSELFCITEYKLKPLTLFGLIKKHNWKRFADENSPESSSKVQSR